MAVTGLRCTIAPWVVPPKPGDAERQSGRQLALRDTRFA